jgi:hypothetical protein
LWVLREENLTSLLSGFRGSPISVRSPALIGMNEEGSLSQFPLIVAVDCYTGLYVTY